MREYQKCCMRVVGSVFQRDADVAPRASRLVSLKSGDESCGAAIDALALLLLGDAGSAQVCGVEHP